MTRPDPWLADVHSPLDSFAAFGDRCAMALLSKGTLLILSRVLEEMVEQAEGPGLVVTGFQYQSHWEASRHRYERLAQDPERTVGVFTRDGGYFEQHRVHAYRILPGSGLRQEWFVLVRTPSFCAILFGLEDQGQPSGSFAESERLFQSGWTFREDLAEEGSRIVLAQLRDAPEAQRSALEEGFARCPVVPAAESVREGFGAKVFGLLEQQRQQAVAGRIRERVLTQQLVEAEERRAQLERLTALGTAVATLAHDINNPLQALQMSLESLDLQLGSENLVGGNINQGTAVEIQEDLAGASSSAKRIGSLTRSILDLARLRSPRIQRVRIADWLEQFVEPLRMALDREITGEIDDLVPESIEVDPDRLYQILSNLVSNADRADRTGQPIQVRFSISAEHRIQVRVSDHGPGVSADLVDSLFEIFTTGSREVGGIGLGLAIASRHAVDMGGRLRLEQTSADGTTFLLDLPLRAQQRAGSPLLEPTKAAARRPGSVLLVEDNESIRTRLTRVLARRGWKVYVATSPIEAKLLLLKVDSLDAVLTDYDLDDSMTGLDLMRSLEGLVDDQGRPTRKVLMTGHLDGDLPEVDGVNVLYKPFSSDQLVNALGEQTARPRT